MLTLNHEPQTAGTCLANLQSIFHARESALDWLVVTHDDPVLTNRLTELLGDKSAAMLTIPQHDLDFGGSDLPSAVQWAINEAGLKHLLLAGHSRAGRHGQPATRLGDGSAASAANAAKPSGGNRLLHGAKQRQQQLQRSKNHFAAQAVHLCEIEEVQNGLVDGRLQFNALFYIAESGAWLLFDLVDQTFKPIVG